MQTLTVTMEKLDNLERYGIQYAFVNILDAYRNREFKIILDDKSIAMSDKTCRPSMYEQALKILNQNCL